MYLWGRVCFLKDVLFYYTLFDYYDNPRRYIGGYYYHYFTHEYSKLWRMWRYLSRITELVNGSFGKSPNFRKHAVI